ncbi:hypothetical protein KI387_036959, partial [Taxus chinensis]
AGGGFLLFVPIGSKHGSSKLIIIMPIKPTVSKDSKALTRVPKLRIGYNDPNATDVSIDEEAKTETNILKRLVYEIDVVASFATFSPNSDEDEDGNGDGFVVNSE